MAITVYKQKTINKNWKQKKNPKKNSEKKISEKKFFFWIFFLQNHEIWPQTESRNGGDHELWNHEMRGSPVSGNLFRIWF